MNASQQHRLDCLVEHYAAELRPHLVALHSMHTTLDRREYIESVARKQGKAVGEALKHAFAKEWEQRRQGRTAQC